MVDYMNLDFELQNINLDSILSELGLYNNVAARDDLDDALTNLISVNKNLPISSNEKENKTLAEIDSEMVCAVTTKNAIQNEMFAILNGETLASLTQADTLAKIDKLSAESLQAELSFYKIKEKIDKQAKTLGVNSNFSEYKTLYSNYQAYNAEKFNQLTSELTELTMLKNLIQQEFSLRQSKQDDISALTVVFDRKKKIESRIVECSNQLNDLSNQHKFFFSAKNPTFEVAAEFVIEYNKKLKAFSDIFQERLYISFQVSIGQIPENDLENAIRKDCELKNHYLKLKKECITLAEKLDSIGYIASAVEEVNSLVNFDGSFLN